MFGKLHKAEVPLQQCDERRGDEAGQIWPERELVPPRLAQGATRGWQPGAMCSAFAYIHHSGSREEGDFEKSSTADSRKSEWEVACTPRQAMIRV